MDQFKIIALFLVTFMVVASASTNMFKQYKTLKLADKKNEEIKTEIGEVKKQNVNLKNQIEYATSSAYIEQQIRDKFGKGSENDVWLVLAPEKKTNLFPEIKTEDSKPNFVKWLELFTK